MTLPNPNFLNIDEEGRAFIGESEILDSSDLQQIFDHFHFDEKRTLKTLLDGEEYIVEAFDAPIVIKRVMLSLDGKTLSGLSQWGQKLPLDPSLFFTDSFDRFYGVFQGSRGEVFFVLHPKAQEQLFDLLDEFDDETLTLSGKTHPVQSFYQAQNEISHPAYWENVYQTEEKPGWDLGAHAAILSDMLPRLKLPKSRVLVLGSGWGHDAAHFASQGHVVTAVDFSKDAIEGAKQKYKDLNIEWLQADVFKLPESFRGAFDIVFEHTCFCAIEPRRRAELIQVWNSCLAPQGKLFGIFFSMLKREGPPYGSTEWEIRKLLTKNFQFVFWSRWRGSIHPRLGRELFVYAQKR